MSIPPSIQAYITRAMQEFRVPGFSLAVIKNGEILTAQGFGTRSLASPAPVDEHTTFAIASISKSFTATALAILVDEGRLRWDDRVSDLLPGFSLADPFTSREMRVRDLLIHNSGIHEVSGGTIWYGSDLDRAEVVRRLRYLKPSFSFRSHYDYQNVMYLTAGQIIPALTGQAWDQFVQARILDPLGMTGSAPNYAAALLNPNRAAPFARLPYASGVSEISEIPYRDHDNVGPAASMHASAVDLARYLGMHLGLGSFAGQTLLTPATTAQLHSAHIPVPIGNDTSTALQRLKPRFMAYGLGWRLFDFAGRKVVQHSGGVDGMRTLVTMIPEESLGIVALSNQEAPLTYSVTYRLMDDLLGLEPYDYAADYLAYHRQGLAAEVLENQQREAARVTGTQPSLALESYAGRYASPLVDFVEVNAAAGSLELRFARTPAFTASLEHWHHDTFRLHWSDPYLPWGLVTFRLNSRGQVESLLFDQPNLLDVDFRELGSLPKWDRA